MKTKIISPIIIAGALFVALPLLALAQWADPTAAAPSGNVPAPINAGSATQEKVGSLVLDNGLALVGGSLSVAPGNNINIGDLFLSSGADNFTSISNNEWFDGTNWHSPNPSQPIVGIVFNPDGISQLNYSPSFNSGVSDEIDHFGNTSDMVCYGGESGRNLSGCCLMNETTGVTQCKDSYVGPDGAWQSIPNPFPVSTPGYYQLVLGDYQSGYNDSFLCRLDKIHETSLCVENFTAADGTWHSVTAPF